MTEEKKQQRDNVRFLVRTMYSFQKNRIQTSNRLQKRKDGENQAIPEGQESQLDALSVLDMVDILDNAKDLEKKLNKKIEQAVKGIPIYEEFLKTVKGCGPVMSAVLISEIDIEEATTRSKIWQYAGLNPAMVRGKKRKGDETVLTDTMIRGDKLTAGFVAPYNTFLKSKLLGVLADCFIKSKSPYTDYYYNMKERLKNSSNEYKEGKKWSEETDAHINNAAKRYMVKMFLGDLYEKWRELEGLEVRKGYQEEYLGHVHRA